MNWTQPQCDACWARLHGERVPVRVVDALRTEETCAWCGQMTLGGIYVRVDPRTVPYPAPDERDPT